jgi:hypothetical protein
MEAEQKELPSDDMELAIRNCNKSLGIQIGMAALKHCNQVPSTALEASVQVREVAQASESHNSAKPQAA